jgi:hypothetical protein
MVSANPAPVGQLRNLFIDSMDQDRRAFGRLREKGVKHLQTSGTIKCPSSSIIFDTLGGTPRAKRAGGTFIAFSDYVTWGEDSSSIVVFGPDDWTPVISNGKTLTLDGATIFWKESFVGDRLIAELCYAIGAVYEDGAMKIPSSSSNTYLKYRRDSQGRLYYMGGAAASVFPLTSGMISDIVSGMPTSGGSLQGYTDLVETSYGTPESVADLLEEAVTARLPAIMADLPQNVVDFGELGVECSAQKKFVESNVLLLVFDVDDWRHFHRMWKTMVNLPAWRNVAKAWDRITKGSGKMGDIVSLFKPASSSYLFSKYAVLPTVGDLGRLWEGFLRSLPEFTRRQRLHTRRETSLETPADCSYARHLAVMTVQCDFYPSSITGMVQEAIAHGKQWGVYPGLVNAWDMLPYSFVADWFVQFGDLFEDVDTYLDQKYYFPVEYVVMSEKWEYGVPITSLVPGLPASGVVEFSYYVRWITRELPLPSVSLPAESLFSKHWTEATALVLQRLRGR